ncbi:polycystic kidney disease protein 1-like 2 [Macrosteles quadrilineatus]|uniref:polycystic kidney disease protein 1-like 2 n=1 Tax=Macrosteles quadrilineatus TaxID=74068 RepID=UPI0023E118F2|nr:polycystic kidney disease protein 1-like 2 [Macrosteles quadrilineatus]
MIPLTILPKPFDLYLNVSNTFKHGSISLSITQLDLKLLKDEDLDSYVNVIRVDVPPRCKMFAKFILNDSSDELLVSIKLGLRPYYELILESSTKINANMTTFNVPYRVINDNQFMYIGVIPSPNTPPGKTVNFSLDYFCNTCLTRFQHTWVTNFCSVGEETSHSTIHCTCKHLSIFSGVFVVPPKAVDPFKEVHLFLTVKDNPYIVLYVVTVLLVFLLLCILAIFKDRKQSAAREVMYLEDNFPDDKYFYILAVFTGCRFMASTNANVGVQIRGTSGRSHAHILKSRARKVLRYNSDDWFLLSTSVHLGTINEIHIWHDSNGRFSDWYCEKILLYDINTSTVYTFFAEEWIALGNNKFPEALLFPATADDFRSLSRIFFENLKHGITHCHILAGIFSRHRDIKMTKLDRVVIICSIIMSASLIGISFFKLDKHKHEGIDDYHYSVGTKTFIKGVQIFLLNAFFIVFFQTIFKLSYFIEGQGKENDFKIYEGETESRYYSVGNKQSYSMFLKPAKRSHMTSYEKFVQMIYKVYRPMTHLPVVLSRSSQVITRRPVYYAIAWMSSILTISLCSYFIILYGLKMGENKSKKWISYIGFAMINHFVVLIPIKIVLVAVILASHFVHLVPISNYKLKTEDVVQMKNEIDHHGVLHKRRSCFYHPLNIESMTNIREQRERLNQVFKIMNLVLISSVIIVVVVAGIQGDRYFDANQHIKMMFQLHGNNYIRSFSKVSNRSQFLDYLMDTVVNSDTFYRKMWYNKYSLSDSFLQEIISWASDCTYQVIGVPVLRQLRVIPNTCSINEVFKNIIYECIPAWSVDVQDNDNYDYKWSLIEWRAQYSSSEWTFQTPKNSELPFSDSVSGISYPRGGYIAKLGTTRYQNNYKLLRLIDGRWVDQYTRVVFGAFTLYNVNTHIFTQIRFVAEHLPTGLYLTKVEVESVAPTFHEALYSIVYIVYTFVLTCKTFITVHRHGKDFIKLKNIFQMFLIGLGILTIVFIVIHIHVSSAYISNFQKDESGVVFQFYNIIKYQAISNKLSILFFAGLVVRLLMLWTFGKVYLNTAVTLQVMASTLILVCVCVVILCFNHWKILNFLNFFSFSRQDCVMRGSVTLIAHRCFQDSPINTIFYMIIRAILCLLLILFSVEYKLVKYRSDS